MIEKIKTLHIIEDEFQNNINNIYIVDDDKINVGDFIVANVDYKNKSVHKVISITPNNLFLYIGYDIMTSRCKKIFATNDKNLLSKYDNVFKIPEKFIPKFNKIKIKFYNDEINPILNNYELILDNI